MYKRQTHTRSFQTASLSLANYVIAAALTQSERPSEARHSRENSRKMRLVARTPHEMCIRDSCKAFHLYPQIFHSYVYQCLICVSYSTEKHGLQSENNIYNIRYILLMHNGLKCLSETEGEDVGPYSSNTVSFVTANDS